MTMLLSFMKNCYWIKVAQQTLYPSENTNAFLIKSHIMDAPEPNINTAFDISMWHHDIAALQPIQCSAKQACCGQQLCTQNPVTAISQLQTFCWNASF